MADKLGDMSMFFMGLFNSTKSTSLPGINLIKQPKPALISCRIAQQLMDRNKKHHYF
jgi:hypothetical protein